MRWLLAGLAFALLVALAVFTVAIQTRNLFLRARIATHNRDIQVLRVEQGRRARRHSKDTETEELIARLREFLQRERQLRD